MRSYQITTFGAPLTLAEGPMPTPRGTEILLRVTSCGVCHSDLHIRDGHFDLGDGKTLDLARSIPLPHVLGHEIVGEVVALGPAAHGIKPGDRRVVYPWIGCGDCPVCARGEEQLCPSPRVLGVNVAGGYADHVLVPDPHYLFDFDPLPEELACTYACSGLTAYGALKKAVPLGKNDPLIIIGAGGVGLAAVRLAKRVTGVSPMVADLDKRKRALAFAAGATATLDPGEDGAARTLLKATDGGVAVAIDFVGAAASTRFGYDVLRKGGKLIVVGLFGGALHLPLPMLPLRAITLQGSYVGSLAEMGELLALARAGAVRPIPTEARPLDRAEATLADLKAGSILGRVVLKP